MNKKKILITGSNGLISSNLINFFEKKNIIVYSTSRKRGKNIYFDMELETDLKIIPKFDVLIHLAYHKSFSYLKEYQINFEGSKRIFEFAKKNKAHIIFLSSQSVGPNSKSNYGKIKYELEKLAFDYKAKIIRPGLIYKQNSEKGLYYNIQKLIKKFPIIIVPNGLSKKIKICEINILCDKIYDLVFFPKKDIFYNLNEPENYTIDKLVKKIASDLGKKIIVIRINYKIVIFLLKIFEFFNLNKNLRSDSIKSLL